VIREGRVPVVVGGTGLYLRALLGTMFEEIPMDAASRVRLQEHFAATSVDELRRWAGVLDPARAALGRTQLLRAIEVALLTGRSISALHEERARPSRWRARYLLVDPGPPLGSQIVGRTRAMFDSGWADEVRALMQSVAADAPAWKASGYRTVRAMVEGQLTLDEAVDNVVIETRQYAKRQRTWFRHQLAGEQVTTIDPTAGDVGARLEAWWSGQAA
jgi:tRNA dimethylallyltransferase